MDEPIKLTQLQLFCAVVENGGYTRAAEHLNMTQPAVSQQVKILERQLNGRLFVRRGNQVLLSETGKVVYEYAQNMLRLSSRLKTAVKSLSTGTSDTLIIGTNRPFGRYILPPLLAGYCKQFPTTEVTVRYANSEDICEHVLNNVVDLGFVTWDPSIELSSRLNTRQVRNDPWCLVVSASSEWAGRFNRIDYTLFDSIPLIASTENSTNWKIVERVLNQLDIDADAYHVRLRLDDIESIKQMVLQGAGMAFLELSAVRQELSDGRLCQFSFPDGYQLAQTYMAVTKTKGHVTSEAAQLLKYLITDSP